MNILAIIPARGGSKGIPMKNLAEINGLPLLHYSVQHALDCPMIQRVIVSTDSEQIAEAARKAGADVPFMRPPDLAEDHVLDHPVFAHALQWLEEKEGYVPDIVVHLRPTAPYRRTEWMTGAIQDLLDHPDAHSVRSVSAVRQHPYRMFTIDQEGYLDPIMKDRHPEPYLLRRQDLPDMYYYNCVIDVTRYSTIIELGSMTGSRIRPFLLDEDEVIDVDTPLDLEIVRKVFNHKLENG